VSGGGSGVVGVGGACVVVGAGAADVVLGVGEVVVAGMEAVVEVVVAGVVAVVEEVAEADVLVSCVPGAVTAPTTITNSNAASAHNHHCFHRGFGW
jgi:hypothetical protein